MIYTDVKFSYALVLKYHFADSSGFTEWLCHTIQQGIAPCLLGNLVISCYRNELILLDGRFLCCKTVFFFLISSGVLMMICVGY